MATILIVDDLSADRALLRSLLALQGHRLLDAVNGLEALAVVQTEHPELVFTDVHMPVMDGYEFVRQLRLDPAIAETAVIFCTAPYGAREARALAPSLGVADVVTKPADGRDVIPIVGRALAGLSGTEPVDDATGLRRASDREYLRTLIHTRSENASELRASNVRLRALINVGLELTAQCDAHRMLESVCAATRDLFGATYVTVGIVNRHNGLVHRFVSCGTETIDWIQVGDAIPGILGTVVDERRPWRDENAGGDPATLGLPARHPTVQAVLAVPIASAVHVYGWICLIGNEGRLFTEDDESLVMALAAHVGRIYELEHEIIERHEAESALRHERDRAQRYLDTAEVILLALDLDGRITLINRKGCDLLGQSQETLIGHNWADTCLPPRVGEPFRRTFQRLLNGDLSAVEGPVLTASGEERLIEWCNTLLRDTDGRITGTFSSGTDTTARNQAIRELRTAEARMRFALESAQVGIWDLDYATGELQWSEILERQYGLLPGTFARTLPAFLASVHPQDREALLATINTAGKSGADFSLQHRAVWPDGAVRWLSGTGRVHVDARGTPMRAVGISLDVTERHGLEEQSQQAHKMEAIGRLAGGVAHDFNNLLTAILGYSAILLLDLGPSHPQHADILQIQRASRSAADLTRQLLAFSRMEIIEPTVLDLNAMVTDTQDMLRHLIREDVTVVLQLEPILAAIKMDRGQLEQIIVNLAVNAGDAMPTGGRLTIETANVLLDEHYARSHLSVVPGPYVALTVTDTGTGMTPQVQAHVFEPFFTTKGVGHGTGLGLATVHGIVTRSGGSVAVYSELGFGTSFKAYFPPADVADIIESTPAPALPPLRAHTVLVVEDSDQLRDLTRRLLERQGHAVLVAASAPEAIEHFHRDESIGVLLTDVVMPDVSGPELANQLVQERPDLKVIYMSGYNEDTIVQHGVLKPGIAFLRKPFTAETLGEKLREVLHQAGPHDHAPIRGEPSRSR